MELPDGIAFAQSFHAAELWKHAVTWRGVPAWKCPLDLWSYQQIVARTAPDVIVECGIAMGGTTLFLADCLELLGRGEIVGVDARLDWVDAGVRAHPRVRLLEGNSTDPAIVDQVRVLVAGRRAMVVLDSDHWVSHVLAELRAYADMVTTGCYLICEDGNLDRADQPVIPGYVGPSTAVRAFLEERSDFEVDETCVLGATFNPGGYLRRKSEAT